MAKTKTKKEPKCETKDVIYCRGKNVSRYVEVRKGDPEFYACWACVLRLRSLGVRFKGVGK